RRARARAQALGRLELVAQARVVLSTTVAAQALLRRDVDAEGARRRADEALTTALDAVADAAAAADAGAWRDRAELRGRAKGAVANALETRAQLPGDPRDRDADFKAATAAWQETTALAPRLFEAWWRLGQLLLTTGGPSRSGEAAAALEHALALRPDDPDTVGMLVVALTNAGREAEAKVVFDAASRRLGTPRELRLVDLRLSIARDDVEGAERKYAALAHLFPGDAEARGVYLDFRRRIADAAAASARLSREPADFEKALRLYDKAIEAGAAEADLHVGAADVLLMLGRFHDARVRYGKAREAAQGAAWMKNLEARAGVLEAVTEERAGRPAEAARAVAEVVRLAPPRLDVGFLVLDEEARRAAPAAGRRPRRPDLERAAAEALLRGIALLVAGDEDAGAARLGEAVALAGVEVPAGSRAAQVVDTARLLRALLRGRHADLAGGARRDLDALARKSPDDPLVAYHRLVVDRTEATARGPHRRRDRRRAGPRGGARALDAVAERARALADRPDLAWPGLRCSRRKSTERGESTAVLGRLNAAAVRFPDVPAVRSAARPRCTRRCPSRAASARRSCARRSAS
ncbi:MAG: hypothetical protein U1E39_15455, partial [Planctomycetota bacterium]